MKPYVFWMTGLSGAGKTTLAKNIQIRMMKDMPTVIIDGDDIRNIYKAGFSPEERNAHLLRSALLCKLIASQGINVIASFITPFDAIRQEIKKLFENSTVNYRLIYVNAPLQLCVNRDVKGLYKQKKLEFTGITQPYEAPTDFDLELKTGECAIGECVEIFTKRYILK